jgi:hypothetical protein
MLNVKLTPDVRVAGYDADRFHHEKLGDVFVINNGAQYLMYAPQWNIKHSFNRQADAVKNVQAFFTSKLDKEFIIGSIDDIIAKSYVLKEANTNTYYSYRSNDTEISLDGKDNRYTVKVNGAEMANTDSFPLAIRRFYREIASVINNQTEDKDQALDLFGESVVQNNRIALQKLAMLNKSQEVQVIKSVQINALAEFFKNSDTQTCMSVNLFDDPMLNVIKGPLSTENIPGGMATKDDMQTGMDDYSGYPSRNDAKAAKPRTNLEQKPIEAEGNRLISPVSISKADEIRQYQRIQRLPEEQKWPQEPRQVPSKGNHESKTNEAQQLIENDQGRPILNRLLNAIKDFEMKDFPNMEENNRISDSQDYGANRSSDNRIGDKQKAIVGRINKLLIKSGYSMDAPKVKPGEKEEPIESKGTEQNVTI